MGFNSQNALGPFGNVVSVTSYGAVGNGVADDRAAIQSALDAVPLDSVIFFPTGVYLISAPLNYTRRVRLVGEHKRGSIIRCSSSFSGSQMMRNWTDADYAAGNDGFRPNTTASPNYYPMVEHLRFESNGKSNLSFIEWVHLNESGYLRDLLLVGHASSSGLTGVRLFGNNEGGLNGGRLSDITCYNPGWKQELYVKASTPGADLQVSNWVVSPVVHTDSLFYFEKMTDISMTDIHVEGGLDSSAPADAALFRLSDCIGFVLRDSLVSTLANQPRPLLKATITGATNSGAPILDGITCISASVFTGTLIADDSLSIYPRTLTVPILINIHRYDGAEFVYTEATTRELKRLELLSGSVEFYTTTPIVLTGLDQLVFSNMGTPSAVSITLPASTRPGQRVTIVDYRGDAGSNNITITPASGLINGAASYVINTNYGSVTLVQSNTDGTRWWSV